MTVDVREYQQWRASRQAQNERANSEWLQSPNFGRQSLAPRLLDISVEAYILDTQKQYHKFYSSH